MAAIKTPLDDLRRQIDELDDQLHDLLMRRTEIVEAIGKEKKDGRVSAFRPGREAVILRRLVARHGGRFPAAGPLPTWREMLAAPRGVQIPSAAAVHAPSAATA